MVLIWFGMALIAALVQLSRHSYRNYLIYKGVFWHLISRQNLFAEYPNEYLDTNHYGPAFSLFIAPFALLPDRLGLVLWCLANAWMLQYAIRKLPVGETQQLMILAIAAIEMMTATHNVQFNTMLTSWIVLAFILVENKKDFWACLFIAAGFFVKLYGIGAILFFLFSKDKIKFIGSFIFWCMILFCLPMLFSSPSFVVHSYSDWYHSLVDKNIKNEDVMASGGWQDISVMGMIRRITHHPYFNNLYVLLPATFLILTPLVRLKQYHFIAFRLSYLAIILISVVIFSSSAESSTYVLPMTGVGIWYILNSEHRASHYLLGFAMVLTSLSSTDFVPRKWNHLVRRFSLKALPCFFVWLWLIRDVFIKDFSHSIQPVHEAG